MRKNHKVIIATRGSKLALYQAEYVRTELKKRYPDIEFGLKKIKTTGDKILDAPLAKIGGKGLFVKEIEEALLRKDADLAVHSMKDIPIDLPSGLHIAAICEREDPRDAIITRTQNTPTPPLPPRGGGLGRGGDSQLNSALYYLPQGAVIGTSSLRRSCQLLNLRPDLKIVQLRGNLDTRLRKLDEGQFDGIVVAVAGLKRLGMSHRITQILEPHISIPAIGQGAIGIECRIDDELINNLIAPLNHEETLICISAERAFLRRLEGGCQVPIAAHARIISQQSAVSSQQSELNSKLNPVLNMGQNLGSNRSLVTGHWSLIIDGLVGSISGDMIIKGRVVGNSDEAESIGIKLAEDLISRGAEKILAEVYSKRWPSEASKI